MTLLEIYDDILRTPDRWMYYSRMNIPSTECDVHYLFESDDNARSFIERYFEAGKKLGVFIMLYTGMDNRWRHTLSVFLLGIALSDLLGIDISEEDEHHNKRHLYHWFLTCLYHDYGYTIENNQRTYPPRELSIHRLFRMLGGTHYLSLRPDESEFSNSVRWRYYDYCRNSRGFINHGIIGGLMLYDQLVSHLLLELKNHGKVNEYTDVASGLHYSLTQKNDFALCADAIIAHNIWFDVSPIEELKLHSTDKHTYKRWLTALLVLCDTIEPLKAFPCCPPISVLGHINLGIDHANNSISIAGTNPSCTYSSYVEKCGSLQKWTYIKKRETSANSIILSDLRKSYSI